MTRLMRRSFAFAFFVWVGVLAPAQGATLTEQRMLEAVNAFRADYDRGPLALSEALSEAATEHAEDLARRGLLDHVGADGADLGARLIRVCYGYRVAAENLASGADTAAGAVVLWIGSPPHRANLLLEDVDEMGVGRADEVLSGGAVRTYWVLDLARKAEWSALPPEAEECDRSG